MARYQFEVNKKKQCFNLIGKSKLLLGKQQQNFKSLKTAENVCQHRRRS